MCSWPTMTLAISSLSFLRAAPRRPMASRSEAVAGAPLRSGLRVPVADIGGILRGGKKHLTQRRKGAKQEQRESRASYCLILSDSSLLVFLCAFAPLREVPSSVLHRVGDD